MDRFRPACGRILVSTPLVLFLVTVLRGHFALTRGAKNSPVPELTGLKVDPRASATASEITSTTRFKEEQMEETQRREPTVDELKKRLSQVAQKSNRRKSALKALLKTYELLSLQYSTVYTRNLRMTKTIQDSHMIRYPYIKCTKFHLFG